MVWKQVLSLAEVILKRFQYKARIETKVDKAISFLQEHDKRLLRLEILSAMDRNDRAVVHSLYDEYKAIGGNSYMKETYKDYCKGNYKRSKK